MSQFDFPRINFHGSVLLDVPTGNNGKFSPLKIYNQDEALPYRPPRVYLKPGIIPNIPAKYKIETDENSPYSDYNKYVEISSVTDEVYDAWAICHLGTSGHDDDYKELYENVPLDGDSPQPMLSEGMVQPSYWNYYGDLSVYAEDIRITGVQVVDDLGNVTTYTPGNSDGCPAGLSQLLGQSFSFHQQFFDPNSRTTAMFCDVDSIGDSCTQMFYSLAGIYGKPNNQEKTFFTGVPCKSAFNWLSLCKVLNLNNPLLSPMYGGTYFNSTIQLNADQTDPQFQQDLNTAAGFHVDALSMKILLHQVYEVRNPDYKKMPTAPLGNNQTSVPKNPARVAFSGSLCPHVSGVDMTTTDIARILKNEVVNNPKLDVGHLDLPIPQGSNEGITIESQVQLPPAFVRVNPTKKVISLDVINTICEYGIGFGDYSCYGGDTAIPPFKSFENFDFNTLSLYFIPDDQSGNVLIGSLTHTEDYNMAVFLAKGGVMDFKIPPGKHDFSAGKFAIFWKDGELMMEDDYLVLTDQKGSYAEENQHDNYNYKYDGSGRGPITLRCFKRGQPIPYESRVEGVYQTAWNQNYPFTFYDKVDFKYPTNVVGCTQYTFAITENQRIPNFQTTSPLYFLANGYYLVGRVLDEAADLVKYLDGTEPLTFEVLYDKILSNYNNVLPIMNSILPFQESVWSEPYTMRRMLMLTDEKNWGGYMYMPVTRELSKNQHALLQMWAKQKINS
ncbi:hypothetical protein [Algoriphagus sediminis]|uniref:Uncharacterized protein n=1 Tax=Algoriphagus sediminis TaxID=3057113 RepID=A0ABT7YC51_9BACT|nr:hypothetical protein [Algoriphagus sediminis]MDN3204107.1 hypothetical protein [Algoriphagus sediminis]